MPGRGRVACWRGGGHGFGAAWASGEEQRERLGPHATHTEGGTEHGRAQSTEHTHGGAEELAARPLRLLPSAFDRHNR